jgi:hypothetical protein
MIVGFVCLLLSALGVSAPRLNLQSLGLSLWILAVILA